MSNKRENVVLEKSFAFAVRTIKLYQFLVKEKKEFVLSKQILRSGTSIGANVEEADGGISKADFSAKMSIAYKEAKETLYWLKLFKETEFIDQKLFNSLSEDCDELCRILCTILKSSRTRK